jgi:hypothetical protein
VKRKYYPRSYKRLYLQQRDVDIIGYCIEQKFLTVEQISKRFFKTTAGSKDPNQAAYKRVLILQKFDMLAIKSLLTGERVVMATEIGAGELAKRRIEALEPVRTVDYRYFEHDRRVNDVRVVLENGGVASEWESDRCLKVRFSTSTRVPDAMFKLANGQAGVLELEIARKAKRRYERIFEDYAGKRYGEVDLVFYVCNTMRQIESLASMTAEYRWVYYALYDQLMRDGLNTMFANMHENFQLKELTS